jgi:hypothetical protein
MNDLLELWTVYDHPVDCPGNWVARKWVVGPGGKSEATSDCIVSDTLEDLRDALPPGLYRLPRDPDDDPVIVETWL